MLKATVILLQKLLAKKGFNEVKPDGIIGPKTMAAVNSLIGMKATFNNEQKLVAALQLLAIENGIRTGEVDGLWGQETSVAADALVNLVNTGKVPPPWRPDETTVNSAQNNWPVQGEASLTAFYGPAGPSQLVKVPVPYPHKLSWDLNISVNSIQAHVKVKDSLQRVLAKVLAHYGQEEIKRLKLDVWGGCYNLRLKRGGTTPSTHSWGIALDYDPDRNQLKWGADKAAFARPEYEAWWRFWEEEGWVSLGRTRNFDWMHVQAARL